MKYFYLQKNQREWIGKRNCGTTETKASYFEEQKICNRVSKWSFTCSTFVWSSNQKLLNYTKAAFNANDNFKYSCREKKDHEVVSLESAKEVETKSIASLEERNQNLRQKLHNLKMHYSKFIEFARKNDIQLQERNIQAVDNF